MLYIVLAVIIIIIAMSLNNQFMGSIVSVSYCPNTPCTNSFTETLSTTARGTGETLLWNCHGGYSADKYMYGTAEAI